MAENKNVCTWGWSHFTLLHFLESFHLGAVHLEVEASVYQ